MSRHVLIIALFSVLAVLLATYTQAPIAHAANIVVNTLADNKTQGDGQCSLREAIKNANAGGDASNGDCVSGSGNDTITFSVNGTITLVSVLPTLKSNLTIDGQNITLDGSQQYPILRVNGTLNTVTLNGLTLANAACDPQKGGGGAITNFDTLNLNSVTFQGNDANACLGGGAINNEGGSLTINGSHFTSNQGTSGGAILSTGSVSIANNSTFSQNDATQGGALYNLATGNMTVANSSFTGNTSDNYGAAILNRADNNNNSPTLSVSESTFDGNQTGVSGYGGGIANIQGKLSVATSTLSNGYAKLGGGIYNESGTLKLKNSTLWQNEGWEGGGGMYNYNGTIVVTNSTLTANTTAKDANGGGIYNLDGALNVTNSTVYGNFSGSIIHYAGGIYNDGTSVTLRNTIVANNSHDQCYDYAESLTADAHNIDDDGTCDQATQKTVSAIAIGPLQDNGGPTHTLALLRGSAAINWGDDNVCAAQVGAPYYGAGGKDQRAVLRPQLDHCDVGAYEFNAESAQGFVVNSTADTSDGECDIAGQGTGNQDCTLREAIQAANADNAGDVITFNIPASASGCVAANACTISLVKSLPGITSILFIDGAPYNGHITIAAASGASILQIKTTTLQLNGLTLINGINNPQGNATGVYTIANNGALVVTNSTFLPSPTGSNTIAFAIANYGTTTVTNSTFVPNVVGVFPQFGGIDVYSGAVTVVNSTMATDFVGIQIKTSTSTVTLRNTIILSTLSVACDNFGKGTLSADAHNIDDDGTCDQATQKSVGEIALGPLNDNGGPTQTFKPSASSAVLNAGDNAVCNSGIGIPNYGAGGLDQRGAHRPQNSTCDVGAVELRIK